MKKLQLFINEEFGEIRGMEVNGKPYVVASDVAKALGYKRPNDAISQHCKYTVKHRIPHPQNKTKTLEVNIIPEGDVYRLIIKSKLPSAQKFEEWVMDEVLPEIRRTGGYIDEGATQQQLQQLQQKINMLTNYKIKGDTINDVCSATGLRRKTIKEYLFDNDWVEEYNGEISTYDGRYIYIMRRRDVHFTKKGLDKILKDLQPRKPKRVFFDKELYIK
jgi:prophage antirepressor-like protein